MLLKICISIAVDLLRTRKSMYFLSLNKFAWQTYGYLPVVSNYCLVNRFNNLCSIIWFPLTKNWDNFVQSGPFEVFLGVLESPAHATTFSFEILEKYVFLKFLELRENFVSFSITVFHQCIYRNVFSQTWSYTESIHANKYKEFFVIRSVLWD